ncbi:hypothetical protein LPTSP3_g07520 [Leptospira kobayashii]|uniref:Hint domain-containing protein n=1 Tax=Leptospira kobayashii TaxID=1917830 RepID=A0ABM7UGW9_9LEPT|nr:TIGR04388 family protein [Leptospira kobayashii]BDA77822.1 hypothetical protein LPTSP3_g07520 [Leptospira kobayashii]
MKNSLFSHSNKRYTTFSLDFGSRIGFSERLTSLLLLTVFLFTMVLPIEVLAQSVPQLTKTKPFRNTDLQPYVESAAASQTSESGFMSIVRGAEDAVEASWEAEVEAEINTILSSVTTTDPVNDVNVYKQAVQAQLTLQKQQAKATWIADASSYIQSELNAFLNTLSAKKDQDIENSKQGLLATINPAVQAVTGFAEASQEANPAQVTDGYTQGAALWDSKWQDLLTKQENWEQDSVAAIQNGILQWNTTISNLTQEKQDYLDGIAMTKEQWLQNKAMIENAENALRSSLQGTVNSIQSQRTQLASSFTGSKVMSDSFGDIDALLSSIQQQLDDHASVSDMAQTLGTFFRNQEEYAKGKADEWNGLKWENITVLQNLTYNQVVGTTNVTCSQHGDGYNGCAGQPTSLNISYLQDGTYSGHYVATNEYIKSYYTYRRDASIIGTADQTLMNYYSSGSASYVDYEDRCGSIGFGGVCVGGTYRAVKADWGVDLSLIRNIDSAQYTVNDNVRNAISKNYNATFTPSTAQGYLAGSEQAIAGSTQVFLGASNITGSGSWYDQLGWYNTVSIYTDYKYIDKDKQANEDTWRGHQANYKSLADTFLGLVNPLKDWEDRSKQYTDEYEISLANLEEAKNLAVLNFDTQIASLTTQRDNWITDVYGYEVAGTGAVNNQNSRFRSGQQAWQDTIVTFKSVELNWFLTAKEALNKAVEDPGTGEKKFQADAISVAQNLQSQIVNSYNATGQLYDSSRQLWNNYQYDYSNQLLDQAVDGKANEIQLGEAGAVVSQKLIDSYARTESYTSSEMDATIRIQNILGMFGEAGYGAEEFESVQANIDASQQGQVDWNNELSGDDGKFGFIPRAARDRNTLALYQDVRDDTKKANTLQKEVLVKENKILSDVEQYFKKADDFLKLAEEFEEKGKFDEAAYYTQQAVAKKAEARSIITDNYDKLGDFMLQEVSSRSLSYTKSSFLNYKDSLISKSFDDSEAIAKQIKQGQNQIDGIRESSEAYDKIQGLLATSQSLVQKGTESQNLVNQLLAQSEQLANKNLKGELLDGLAEMIAAIESGAPTSVSDGSEIAEAINASNQELKETREQVDGLLSHMNSLVTNENDIKNLGALLNGSSQALNYAANSAIAKYLDEYSQQFIEENEARSKTLRQELFLKYSQGDEYAYLRKEGYEFRIQGDFIVGSRTIHSGDFKIAGNAMQDSSYSPLFMAQNIEINTKFDPGTLRVDTLGIDTLMNTEFDADKVSQVAAFVDNMATNMDSMFAQFSDKTEETKAYYAQNEDIKAQNIETYNRTSNYFLTNFQGLEEGFSKSYTPNMGGLRDNYKQSKYNFRQGTLPSDSKGENWVSIKGVPVSTQRYLGSRELKGTVNIKGIPIEMSYGMQDLNVPAAFSLGAMGHSFELNGMGTTYATNEVGAANGAFTRYLDGTIKDVQAKSKANDEEKESKGFLFDVLSGTASGQNLSQSFKSVVTERVNGAITSAIAEATGLPAGLISGLVGGKSMKEAMKDYVKQEATSAIAEATGIPAWAISQQLDKMSKPKEKFYETSTFKTVIAVAAVVAAPFTGGASLVALAAIGAAQGAASGGLQGAMVGAVGGVVNGLVAGATGGTVNVGLSYDSENGFGASVGLLGGAASLSVSENGGVAASVGIAGIAKVGVSYSKDEGFGVSAGLAIGALQAGVNYTQKSGTSIAVGVKTENGLTAGVTYSKADGFGAALGATTGNYSGGLTYNKDEGFGAFVTQNNFNRDGSIGSSNSLTFNQRDGAGLERTNNNADGSSATVGVTQNGGLTAEYSNKDGYSVSAGYNFNTGGFNVGYNNGYGQINYDSESGISASGNPVNDPKNAWKQGIVTSQSDLKGSLQEQAVAVKAKYQELDNAKKAWLEANGGATEDWDDLSDDEKEKRVQNKSAEVNGAENRDEHTTRDNILERAWGNVKDFAGQMAGNYSDHSGSMTYDQNGNATGFKDRTCFVAGTKVHTKDGLKNIEEIQVGDEVASWNETTKEVSYKLVTELFVHEVDLLFDIQVAEAALQTTWNHPFWVVDKQAWVEAKDLQVGENVLLKDGKQVPVTGVLHNDVTTTKVYNLEIENNHTYFVGEDGILVHNYDLGSMFNQIVGWESLTSGSNDATAVAAKANDCAKNPAKCTAEVYGKIGEAAMIGSGGISVPGKLGVGAAPYVFSTMLRFPKAAYPFWKAATALDYNVSINVDDQRSKSIEFGAGKGPLKASFAVGADKNWNFSPSLGLGLEVTKTRQFSIDSDGNIKTNNNTLYNNK